MGLHRLQTIAIATTAALFVVLAYCPSAQADRRSSLAGNLLIEDQDDVFLFPHVAKRYVRTLSLDLGLGGGGGGTPGGGGTGNDGGAFNNGAGDDDGDVPVPGGQSSLPPSGISGATSSYGSAGVILGDESLAVGIFAHRGDTVNNLANSVLFFGDIDTLALTGGGGGTLPGPWPRNGNAGLVSPLNWIDTVVALGDSNFGVRLSLGLNSTGTEQDRDGDVTTQSNSAFAANLVVGYGMEGDLDLDIAAEIGFASQSYELAPPDGDPTTDSATNIPSVSLLARGYSPLANGVELGFMGLFDYRSASNEFTAGDDDPTGSSDDSIALLLGAGPVYTLEDKFTLATTASLGVLLTSSDPNINADVTDDQSDGLAILLPELKLSGEFYVTDWMLLRAGAVYRWVYTSNTQEVGENNTDTESSTVTDFQWIAGIGLDFDDLQINGTLNPQFVMNGPHFIGGTAGMFALVNVSYNFN